MVITKREDVTKQGFCNQARFRGSLLLELIQENLLNLGGVGVGKWTGWGWALY